MSSHKRTPSYRLTAKKKVKTRLLSNILIVTAVAMLITGSAVSFRDWQANKAANQQAAKLVSEANRLSSKHTVPTATTNSSPVVPSTIKPAVKVVAEYIVAPDMPRYLIIPKLGVNARILSVGLDSQGALLAPKNVYDTAWYNGSSQPGQPGAMLIDGHVSSWTAHGVFYGIKSLRPGDTIKVQRGDNTLFTYHVVKTQLYDASNVDMVAAMLSIDPSIPGLNLISCTGDVISGTNDFNQRIIVFATLD